MKSSVLCLVHTLYAVFVLWQCSDLLV